MFAAILAAVLASHGTPARAIDSRLVIVEGRPECHAEALHGDPTRPVVVCSSSRAIVLVDR